MPDRLDRLIGWRILPRLRFLRAVEGNHYEALWRFAPHSMGLTATNDIVAVERRQCSRDLIRIFLKGSGIRYIDFRDNVANWRLDLPRMNCRGARNTDCDAN